MKRACLFAFIGSSNLGDEAIFQTIYQDLKSAGYLVNVISTSPSTTKKLLGKALTKKDHVYNAKNVKETTTAIKTADIFVCGGGGLLQDHTSIFNIPYYVFRCWRAHFYKKPVFFYGISAGPVRFLPSKFFIRTLNWIRARFTVRDEESKDLLVRLGIAPKRILVTADPALNLPATTASAIIKKSKIDPQNQNVIVCLRHWFDTYSLLPVSIVNKFGIRTKSDKEKYNRFVIEAAKTLDTLHQKGSHIIFLSFWTKRDGQVHKDVISHMKNTKNTHILDDVYTPGSVKALMKTSSCVIAMRLHAAILAASANTPFISIAYSDKVWNFVRSLGNTSKLAVSVDTFTEKELTQKVETILGKKPTWGKNVLQLKEKEKKNIKALESNSV